MRDGLGLEKVTLCLMRDCGTKGFRGRVVNTKGRDGDLAIRVIQDVLRFGHGEEKVD